MPFDPPPTGDYKYPSVSVTLVSVDAGGTCTIRVTFSSPDPKVCERAIKIKYSEINGAIIYEAGVALNVVSFDVVGIICFIAVVTVKVM